MSATHRPEFLKVDGEIFWCPKEQADVFAKRLSEVFVRADFDSQVEQGRSEISVGAVTAEQVLYAIKKIKNNKAADISGVVAELYKYVGEPLADYFAAWFTSLLNGAELPSNWQSTVFRMLHKKGDRGDPANFRSIAIIPMLYKVVVVTMVETLGDHFERGTSEMQTGGRKGFSVVDNLVTTQITLEHMKDYFDDGFLAAVDFRVAFDSLYFSTIEFIATRKDKSEDKRGRGSISGVVSNKAAR